MYRDSYRIVLFFLLLCNVVLLFAQETKAPTENNIVLQTEETALPVQEETPRQINGETSTAAMLFQLILSLAIVCALIYGVLYFIRRSRRFSAGDDPFLKNVATLPLAPNKTLYIVTLIDKAYLIGAADASLSLIAEITDKELIDAMNLHAAQAAGPKQNFNSFLHTFFPAAKPKEAEANPFDSFLTKQRNRLQNSSISQEHTTLQKMETGNTELNARLSADNDAKISRIRADDNAAVNEHAGEHNR